MSLGHISKNELRPCRRQLGSLSRRRIDTNYSNDIWSVVNPRSVAFWSSPLTVIDRTIPILRWSPVSLPIWTYAVRQVAWGNVLNLTCNFAYVNDVAALVTNLCRVLDDRLKGISSANPLPRDSAVNKSLSQKAKPPLSGVTGTQAGEAQSARIQPFKPASISRRLMISSGR